jgi:hypothetical protein
MVLIYTSYSSIIEYLENIQYDHKPLNKIKILRMPLNGAEV